MSIILVIGLVMQLLFYAAVIGIGLFIQVKLSRSNNKYLGFILPGITFILGGLLTLGIAQFSMMTDINDGVTEVTNSLGILKTLFLFLVSNIPTMILSGIYINERNKVNMKKEIEKMMIDDL